MLDVNKEKKVLINNNLKLLNIKHLLTIRSSLGHKLKYVNFFAESFILGTINNIAIFHIEYIWKSLRLFYEILVYSFFRRNSFFLILTNKNLPSKELGLNFEKKYLNKFNLNYSLYFLGYIHHKWFGSLLLNWTRIYLLLKKFINSKKRLSKKQIQILRQLKGVWHRHLYPTYPDFVFSLDSNVKAIHELYSIRLPVLGIADVNINPFKISLPIIGNDDSLNNIEFLCKILEETTFEGRQEEQELFFHLIFFELHKILNHETIL